MPTSLGVGTTSFQEISVQETVSRSGLDSLTVVLKGKATGLAAARTAWRRGDTYTGYPTMFLDTKDSTERGPVAELTLNFIGFIDSYAAENGIVDIEDNISRQSVTINTDEDENVSFSYYAQTSTTRWIYRGTQKPRNPKFPAVVPTDIPISYLFQPDPPNYSGSITNRYQPNGRLAQFARTRLAPSVWAVVETWEVLVEPVSA
jgi:hypothetical protein